MEIYQIAKPSNPKKLLKDLGVESGGVSIMRKKMNLLFFYIKDLKTPAVNILKQDALSIGAELAVPSGAILCAQEKYDVLLIANIKQIEILSKKELSQPFGLKKIAHSLKVFLKNNKAKKNTTKIMGIINANSDSFYTGSRFLDSDATRKIEEMIEQGADIIDIGGVSSRPGSKEVDTTEELRRVSPICDTIKVKGLNNKALFSIDSYSPKVIEYALKSGFGLINDITGGSNPEIIDLAIKYNAKLCIMHMQGKPQDMQEHPMYDNVVTEVSSFFDEKINMCEGMGLSRENIILDVGIGFGKSLDHNLELLRNIEHYMIFGCELLIGASRKSMINLISPSNTDQRLAGTLAMHLYAVNHGVSIVRCHDVYEHSQALSILKAIVD